jgi:hypothetical protein
VVDRAGVGHPGVHPDTGGKVMQKIYIDRDTSSEYSATDLYEDWMQYMVEAEISEEDWLKCNKVVQAYWMWQDKLCDLYEKGKKGK